MSTFNKTLHELALTACFSDRREGPLVIPEIIHNYVPIISGNTVSSASPSHLRRLDYCKDRKNQLSKSTVQLQDLFLLIYMLLSSQQGLGSSKILEGLEIE